MGVKRAVRLIVSFSLVASVSFSSFVTLPDEASAYIPHGPIYIFSNADFTPANGVTSGSGTPSDPFVIEGWEITSPFPNSAIKIDTTDVHFVIRNNRVYKYGYSVISLMCVENAKIENNVVSGTLNEVFVGASQNITVRNNTLTGGHPIYANAAIFVAQSNNTTASENSIVQTGQSAGISYDIAFNSTAERNDITRAKVGIELHYAYDITISGNAISAAYQGIRVGDNSDNTTIIDNTISVPDNTAVDIFLELSENDILVNNTMSLGGILIYGDELEHWNTHVIGPSNTVIGKPVRYLKNYSGSLAGSEAGQVIIANCSGVDVNNLDIGLVHVAFQIGFSRNSMIARNHVHENHWGILIHSSHASVITQNTIRGNHEFGIHFDNSTNNEIVNNTFTGNIFHGIDLIYSTDNRIHNNTVSFSGMYAISLWKSNLSLIVDNVILSNKKGIVLLDSRNNKVHHNSMMGNLIQAEDDLYNQKNAWDNGYPSGGNYWSDYSGVDTRMGPNQNSPGADGIGDTPYLIAIDNLDRYPLMFPTIMPPPQPPGVSDASLVGMNLEHVSIEWTLSPDDGGGLNSVVGYEIYRNSTYDWGGWDYAQLASMPNKTAGFTDNSAGEGDPNNYFYMICAVDVNNKKSCGWNQAGKFTRPVDPGKNLLSVPLLQSDESLEKVLQTLEFDRVWTYDSVFDDWTSYADSKPYRGGLITIDHKIGFWVNVTKKSNLTVAGIVPLSTMLQLKAGWNLVPFPSFRSTYTVSDVKAGTWATRVEGLNPFLPPYSLRVLADAEPLQAGHAYWVKVETNRIWTVDNA